MIQDFINRGHRETASLDFEIALIKEYKINTKETFVTGRYSILIVNSGILNFRIHEIPLILNAQDMLVLPENLICRQLSGSKNLKLVIVSFTSHFAFKNFIKKEMIGLLYLFMKGKALRITLNEKDFVALTLIGKLIILLSTETRKSRTEREWQKIGIDFLLYELAGIFSGYNAEPNSEFSNKDYLTLRFLSLLGNYFTTQHNAKFYAESLCVTSGYLNKVIKEKTGSTAKKMIAEVIIMEAKRLLAEYKISITEISRQLEFADVAAFTNFFKKYTLLSPSQYRSENQSSFD